METNRIFQGREKSIPILLSFKWQQPPLQYHTIVTRNIDKENLAIKYY